MRASWLMVLAVALVMVLAAPAAAACTMAPVCVMVPPAFTVKVPEPKELAPN